MSFEQLDEISSSIGTIPTYVALFVGTLRLLSLASSFLRFTRQHFFTCGTSDLLKRYDGKGTWALVTGASDGIGAEYCR